MALDDFKSDNKDENDSTDNTESNIIDSSVNEEISHLIKQIDELSIRKNDRSHYNSKIQASISLAKYGYLVYFNHDFDSKTKSYAEIYAEYNQQSPQDVGEDEQQYKKIVVEIGDYSAGQARDVISQVDCIILIPKGQNIDEGLIITRNNFFTTRNDDIPKELLSSMNDSTYVNSEGAPFVPELESLYVERYKEIATVMLNNISDASDLTNDEFIDIVNRNSEKDYGANDVLKVATEVGYRNR